MRCYSKLARTWSKTSTEYHSIPADHGTFAVNPDRISIGIITSRAPRQSQEHTPRFRQFTWWEI